MAVRQRTTDLPAQRGRVQLPDLDIVEAADYAELTFDATDLIDPDLTVELSMEVTFDGGVTWEGFGAATFVGESRDAAWEGRQPEGYDVTKWGFRSRKANVVDGAEETVLRNCVLRGHINIISQSGTKSLTTSVRMAVPDASQR